MNIQDLVLRLVRDIDVSSLLNDVYKNPELLDRLLKIAYENKVIKDDVVRELFIDSCARMFSHTENREQQRTAILITISLYDNLIRSVNTQELKKLFANSGSDGIKARLDEIGKLDTEYKRIKKKIEDLSLEVESIEREISDSIKNKNIDSFIHSLLYAADRWGTKVDIKVVKRLTERIKIKNKILKEISK